MESNGKAIITPGDTLLQTANVKDIRNMRQASNIRLLSAMDTAQGKMFPIISFPDEGIGYVFKSVDTMKTFREALDRMIFQQENPL